MNTNPFIRPNEIVRRVKADYGVPVTTEEVLRVLAIFAVAQDMHKAEREAASMAAMSKPGSVTVMP